MMGRSADQQKLAAARLAASARFPYLASALFAASVVPTAGCNTISVDERWQIHADPAWVERLDVDDLARLFVHHIGHLIRTHGARARAAGVDVDHAGPKWNRCADAEINDDLEREDFVPRVAPDLPRDLGCENSRLVEEYYATVNDGGSCRWDCGSGSDGIPRPWEGGGGIDRDQSDLLCLSVAGDIHAQPPGTVPGGWLRWAERVLPSRTDWRRALAAEVRHGVAAIAGNVDYTYKRPSRRASAVPGVILPSLRRPVPDVAIVCDTSGSMHEELLGRALSEVEGILTRAGLRQGQVRVLAVDTNVHAVRRVSHAAQVELAGGGGTDMGVGITAAATLRPRPSVIVVLTDGFTPWPAKPPKGIRVVVGLLAEGHGPFHQFPTPEWARTIRIEPSMAR